MVVRFPSVDTSSCLSGLSSLSWLICRRPVGVAVMGQASKQLTFRLSYRRNDCDVWRGFVARPPWMSRVIKEFQQIDPRLTRCPREPIIRVKSSFDRRAMQPSTDRGPVDWKVHGESPPSATQVGGGGLDGAISWKTATWSTIAK